MATLQYLIEAVQIVFSWPTMGWAILGILIGIILGAIPGIGAAIGMAIMLPLTAPLDGGDAIILFTCMYLGGMYGGSIAAILINTPGTAGAAATTLDGYPLSKQGLAVNALTISAISSGIGGLLAIIALILITPYLTEIVLAFGSPEYFMIAVLGLSMITIVAQGSMIKGLTTGAFGLLISTIGISPVGADIRYNFDILLLFEGLSYVGVLIGVFAIAEMFKLAASDGQISDDSSEIEGKRSDGIKGVLTRPVTVIKCSLIGMGIGAIPGAGSSVSNFAAYAEAMRSDENPDSFGDGNERGVIAAEAANSATVAGSLIPTLSFGIPGSGTTAVLLGALLMHGLRPGPSLFSDQVVTTYSFFIALFVGNFIIIVLGLAIIAYAGYVTKVDTDLIVPLILVLSLFGTFALRSNPVDILTALVFGIIGFYMVKNDYSIIALVLGVVLGPIAERNLHRSLQISDGSYMIFFDQPLSLAMVILTVLILVGPVAKSQYEYRIAGNG